MDNRNVDNPLATGATDPRSYFPEGVDSMDLPAYLKRFDALIPSQDAAFVPLAVEYAIERQYVGEPPSDTASQQDLQRYANTLAQTAQKRNSHANRVLTGQDLTLEIVPADVIRAKQTIDDRFRPNQPDDQNRLDEYRKIYKRLRDKIMQPLQNSPQPPSVQWPK